MALTLAQIAEISDSMSLSEDSSDFSWVSQIIFPGPYPLAPLRQKKTRIFPEGHHQGHGAGRWLGFPAAAACMLHAEY